MRTLIATLMVMAVPATGSALPLLSLDSAPAATLVQNRFLPGFLGGGDRNNNNSPAGDENARIEQLEAQVRMLTGQVEQLTFSVRRMEALIQRLQAGDQQGALSAPAGPGAPPRPLGTIPAGSVPPSTGNGANTAAAAPNNNAASGTNGGGGLDGPIDLSVLNNSGIGTGFEAPSSQSPMTNEAPRQAAAPASNPALANVRELQNSGRYQMAADEARALVDNPDNAVAGEARYLLGEALLAQGDYRGAANQFLENYTSDPNSPRAPASLLKLGTALNGLGEKEAACSSLEELFGAYPNVDGELRAAAERERQAANCA